ncbi:Nucleoside-diphosphate-sugar epimerase [Sphingomonas guangdongensis]|uniref:Nucleoside-diphosphate-sugar epimerase n=1 Tax=Sphingomonas guangdongensis TaxID=1141890 RepID=A0A285QYK6_9SPHN|nr:NAD-dependent epimerase/dehydratase family protein [Sphingomonas guangdongensis]SOB86911.1 Nucleoside-diphosphate-sugar epimerase [Sphingomonas guangdongensis]
MRIAVTGATGFVGARLLDRAIAAGHRVNALTRRAQPPREGVAWVSGALNTADALAELVTEVDAVIHVAGVVNAPDHAGFAEGNIAGTEAIVTAATRGGVRRFVHVSSLAAREPQLSNYGWSKAEAERVVRAAAPDWDMVRPPAIYGPGDMDQLELFRLARRGLALTPPAGRLSLLHVDDLARLLLALAQAPAGSATYEADDGASGGYSYADFARAIGTALGKRVRAIAMPRPLMEVGAWLDRLARGDKARLTPDRVAYFCHPDWVIDPAHRPPPTLWQPVVPTPAGLADTAAWYRSRGLL